MTAPLRWPLSRQTYPLRIPEALWAEASFHCSFVCLHLAAIGFHAAAVLHHAYLALESMRRQHGADFYEIDY